MARKKASRHSEIGSRHRATARYSIIKHRLAHTDAPKNKGYKGIKLIVSREEFIPWFMDRDFEGCSVDRIDKTKDYSLDNMQVLSLTDNIIKDKLIAKNGKTICYSCKAEKPLTEFTKDRRRIATGRTTICKLCDSLRKYKGYEILYLNSLD